MDKHLETQVANAEEKLRQAMLSSNVLTLDELFSSDLVFTDHLGRRIGKEDDLAAHKSGALNIALIETLEQHIQPISEKVVVVSVRVKVEGTYEGQPAGGDFMFTRVWSMSQLGKWQVVAAHSGMID